MTVQNLDDIKSLEKSYHKSKFSIVGGGWVVDGLEGGHNSEK